jgi:rhodanese-related sulfurtransferase
VGQRGTPKHDEALALIVDVTGSAATVGAYHSYGVADYRQDTDAYLQVRDATDMLVKDAVWGSPGDDAATAVAVDLQGNHLVTGWTADQMDSNPHHGGRDAFVAKWGDDELEPLWVRQWGSSDHDTSRAVAVDSAGNVFVVGSTLGQLGDAQVGGEDLFVTKWDAAGNRVWSEQWGTPQTDVASAAAVDAAGHLWIAGRTAGELEGEPSAGGYDAFLAELDGDGQVVQVLQFGTTSGDAAQALALDGSGNIWVAGITQGDLNGEANSGGIDSFVIKLDAGLMPVWTRLWGTTSEDLAAALALDATGASYLATTVQATTDLACEPGQIWAVGWDTDGVDTLSQSWDSCGAEAATGIAVKPDGQVQLVGWTKGDLVNESRGGKDIISITLQP